MYISVQLVLNFKNKIEKHRPGLHSEHTSNVQPCKNNDKKVYL